MPSKPKTKDQRPRTLKSLGQRRDTPFTYTPALLEAVPLAATPDAGPSPWVSLLCLRFTSLCPVTSQPDWAELDLNYLPDGQLIESKSLKEYLNSFRMHGGFHEDVCRTVCRDLAACIRPRYLEVIGRFDSRGSIAIWPYVQYAASGDAEAEAILAHRRRDYAPGRWSPAGPPR
jgi:7-cyano-7-deazaguanine reductase